MAPITTIFYASIVVCFTHAKIYKKCELARELLYVHRLPEDQIATWVCIAKHESNYDTSAINRGSGDHGLFQISDLYWCSPPGSGFACNRPCSAFEDDDISDDVGCIKTIFEEHTRISGNGFNAWIVYPIFCKGDVSGYTTGCFDNIDNTIDNEEKPVYNFSQPASTEKPYQEEDDEDYYEFPPLPTPPKTRVTPLEYNYQEPSFPSYTHIPPSFLNYFSQPHEETTSFVSPFYPESYSSDNFAVNDSTSFYNKEHTRITTTRKPPVPSTTTSFTTVKKYSKVTQEKSTPPSIRVQNRFDVSSDDYKSSTLPSTTAFVQISSSKNYTPLYSTLHPPSFSKTYSTKSYTPFSNKASFTTIRPFTRKTYKPFTYAFSRLTTKLPNTTTSTSFSRKYSSSIIFSTQNRFSASSRKISSTTPRTFSLRSTTTKPTSSVSMESSSVSSNDKKQKTVFSKKFPSTPARPLISSKVSRLSKFNGSNNGPHQTFYKADKLQYNFFTKTYGFKLVGQF